MIILILLKRSNKKKRLQILPDPFRHLKDHPINFLKNIRNLDSYKPSSLMNHQFKVSKLNESSESLQIDKKRPKTRVKELYSVSDDNIQMLKSVPLYHAVSAT